MTDQRELDRILGAFFVEGTNELPDRVINAALEQIDHTPQRHAVRMPWRLPRMNMYTRLAAAAILGLVAVGGSLYLAGLRQHQVIGPSPTSSASASPSESAHPDAAVYAFTKGAGSAAECGGSRGGCIPRLWVANLDGSGAHELLPDQSGCQRFQAWSPDGTRLLFTRSECRWNGEAGLTGLDRFYLTDPTGSQPQLVDTGCVDLCVSEDDAVFSADGLRILFVRTRSIPPAPSATDPVTGKPAQPTDVRVLASIDLATGRVTELGDFDQCDRCGTESPRSDPRWSPDRTQIVYTWKAPEFGPQAPAQGAVFVVDADGGNVHQIAPAGGAPSWSPDGTRIVLQIDRYEEVTPIFEYRFFSDIYTIRPDGSDLRRLTTDEISLSPAWSVDGRIWFTRIPRVDGNQATEPPPQYWVMDADGSHPEQVSGPPQPQDLAGGATQPTP
jgi:dipeptidyl aminopeptidase/acylaminoacyl peptidase